MSETIQIRSYDPCMAALLQQRPSTIIRAANVTASGLADASRKLFGAEWDRLRVIGRGYVDEAWSMSTGTGAAHYGLMPVDIDRHTIGLAIRSESHATRFESSRGEATWLKWVELTKAALLNASSHGGSTPTGAASMRVRRLASIQSALGMPITDLARVLCVSRQALYKWLDASNELRLQEASRARLTLIERIAAQWRERSQATLSTVVHEPLEGGDTLFAILSGDEIDEIRVTQALDSLVRVLQNKPRTRSQKLFDAGYKRRTTIRPLPSDE